MLYKMGLYRLFCDKVEIQYKNTILSKAMFVTVLATSLNIILPFVIAYRSRGFWLKTHSFFEQPKVQFTYEYLLVAETEDPSQSIVCSEAAAVDEYGHNTEELCSLFKVQEFDYNSDGKNDAIEFNLQLNILPERTITSILLMLTLDFQLKTVCPMHMQSLSIIHEKFSIPPNGLKYYGDLQLYQVAHLPCLAQHVNLKYNTSLLYYQEENNDNIVDNILENYLHRSVITETKTLYSKSDNGHTGTMDLKIHLRIPETKVLYRPSLLQELKWAWPQYLSLALIFYWLFDVIKSFIFRNRLVMAWQVVPWKKVEIQ